MADTTSNLKKSPPQDSWVQIKSELRDALDVWTEITKGSENRLDPETEKLQKVRQLLDELRLKLEEF